LALGAAAIPILAAEVTSLHYASDPTEYLVSPQVVISFAPHTSPMSDSLRQRIRLNNMQLATLTQVKEGLQSKVTSGESIKIESTESCVRKNEYLHDGDHIIAMPNLNLLVCVFHFPSGERYGVEQVVLQIRDKNTKNILVNFTSLFSEYDQLCPLYTIFLSGKRLRPEVAALDLATCFDAGIDGLTAHNHRLQGRIAASSSHPIFGFHHMLLHQISRAVGADFKLFEPVGVAAGLLSIVWSTLLAAYFFMFVAIVLLRRK